ncbi:hypothetical protein [Reyranella sp.]|uniref:hypothetical protein n=1 Tax=Reyranella sp. TaxID=1929291 RepID=UPI00272FDBAA|nr:hypothetical protein [Reyranella sp.]MDP2376100.1 hypothetical protein [Reyranella sp.]
MSDDYFDWDGADIDVPHQARITVYTNPDDHIVIRQDGDWYRRDDAWIVVLPENVPRLVETLLTLASALARTEAAQLALPAPADRTAAERQRRHRERKRNGHTVTVTPVTHCATKGADLFPD